jgi:hypothetical protein
MLLFGDTKTETKYFGDLAEVVVAEVSKTKSKKVETIVKNILKKHGRFVEKQDVVEMLVTYELTKTPL